jgi:hypothetical protein
MGNILRNVSGTKRISTFQGMGQAAGPPAVDSYGNTLTPLTAPNGVQLVIGKITYDNPNSSTPIVAVYRATGFKQGNNGYRCIASHTTGNTPGSSMKLPNLAAFNAYIAKGQIIEYVDGPVTNNSQGYDQQGNLQTGVSFSPGFFFADPNGVQDPPAQQKSPLFPQYVAAWQWGMTQLANPSQPVTNTAPTMSQTVVKPTAPAVPVASSSKWYLYAGIGVALVGGYILLAPSGK